MLWPAKKGGLFMARYFEDYKIGDRFTTPGRTVSEGALAIIEGLGGYCAPFMIDEEFAKATPLGGRIAPGRAVAFLMGGLVEMSDIFDLETVIALMGLNNIRFRSPLRAGDTIRVEMEITDMRETKNPERGLLIHKEICKNQRGEVVAEVEGTHLIKRKTRG